MIEKIFSDYFAQRENFLTNIDVRLKIIFVMVCIVVNLLSQFIFVPIGIFLFVLFALLIIRIPLKLILFRIISPFGIAVVVLFIQIFFYGQNQLFNLNLFGFHLIGFKEGLFRGLFIMCRIIGAVSLILFLSMTTPVNHLLKALSWFKIPLIWIEIALLTYRYIFVLIEDAINIKNAQRVRLGYNNWKTTLKSLGVLVGTVVIRAYDQAQNTYQAMILRGYKGKLLHYEYNRNKKN